VARLIRPVVREELGLGSEGLLIVVGTACSGSLDILDSIPKCPAQMLGFEG